MWTVSCRVVGSAADHLTRPHILRCCMTTADTDSSPPEHGHMGRVLVNVATPGLPQGGPGEQEPSERGARRGAPLDVQRGRVPDEERNVRGAANG